MKRRIITTSDGSRTISLEDWNEHYHSTHGAVNEACHVFIDHGLAVCQQNEIRILEVGFGTGLNALITLNEAQKKDLIIHYTGVEAYPISMEEVEELNYARELDLDQLEQVYREMHLCRWDIPVQLTPEFTLTKQKKDFGQISDEQEYDLIYFDAFGPRVQPELWTESIFIKMFNALKSNGVLVTYSAKGSVRRAMQAAGFTVDRLPGPPGKREMLRANKA
ncbi:tRNA (5-methylaminomethyl-2-thiouridine)(34)-methyltransferase MnmD [Muriicola marianensis]|uniref:MnmC-like methyltransferase domain-containing protein n=1 Tax=Muriicola marianensis TaxID=1324801 RepID=A0ABQ1R391_9FLAO|nr:tRNA (5-methylaminomethyl-2-thiouridine)(34)-methyltransferase MnmD [Muriicola marianensis]GGD56657.1 hypothetical protein GCM10011361_24010 [Muriicola marianensis]